MCLCCLVVWCYTYVMFTLLSSLFLGFGADWFGYDAWCYYMIILPQLSLLLCVNYSDQVCAMFGCCGFAFACLWLFMLLLFT